MNNKTVFIISKTFIYYFYITLTIIKKKNGNEITFLFIRLD